MKHAVSILALLIWSAIALIFQTNFALAERRVALVIGNSNYNSASLNLTNPKDDAEDVAAALQSLGFEVLVETDLSLSATDRALQKFARMAAESDTALFFYAGHALQYQGHNYLMPVDAEVKDEISLPFETIAVEKVRSALDRASGIKIMVLDACRNNPVAEKLAKLSGPAGSSAPLANERTRGLERIDKSEGLIVAYATGADEVALDGQGRNSPFTAAFLRRLNEPGLEIEMMFRRIANDVNIATGGRQRPETYVSLVSEYYLNQNDRIAWDQVKNTNDPSALRDFLAHYPSSYYAIEAHYRLDAMERAIEETKQRSLQEAEARRKEAERAEQQAAAKLKIEKACIASKAALEAIGPRDQAALKSFLESQPCDDAKTIAQARMTALQTLLAQEAETCRRDGEALKALGPRDLAGAKALAQRTACADVKTAAQNRAASIEADAAQEQEICKREDAELKGFTKSGDRAGIDNLRQRGRCPATAAAADQAARDVIAAAEAEICRREDSDLKTLAKSGDRAGIDNLRQRGKCPATAAAAEQSLRDLTAAADAACAKENASLAAIGPRDADALRNFAGKASCDAVKTSAQLRLNTLEARLAHEKDVCKRDDEQWKRLSQSNNRADIATLRASVECPAVISAIDQKMADLKAVCDRDNTALSSIGAHDIDGLRAFMNRATCEESKASAQARLAPLEAEASRALDLCHRDEELWKSAGSTGKSADIEAVRQKLGCPAVIALADKALADLKAACTRENSALNGLAADDVKGARALADHATCEEARIAAAAKLASMEAQLASREETCRKEDAQLEALKTKGFEARNELVAFERGLSCERLRPSVHAALEHMAARPPEKDESMSASPVETQETNSPELIAKAQTELHRLGCFDGANDGKIDNATREGLDRYYRAHSQPVPRKSDIKIGSDFVTQLKAEKAPACAVASLPDNSVKHLREREEEKLLARHPREERPPRREAEHTPPPREHYSEPPHQYGGGGYSGGGGGYSGGGGGGGGASSMGGVGF